MTKFKFGLIMFAYLNIAPTLLYGFTYLWTDILALIGVDWRFALIVNTVISFAVFFFAGLLLILHLIDKLED